MEKTRTIRIAVGALVGQSYAVMLRRWGTLLKLVWLPTIVLAFAGTVLLFMKMDLDKRLWTAVGFQGAMYLLFVPAVTSWHRLILLGPRSRLEYWFGREEILYVEVLMGVGVAVYMFMLVSGLMFAVPLICGAAWATANSGVEWLYRLSAWLVSFLVVARFLLVVPAAALDRDMKMAASGTAMRRNVLRFAAAYFFVLVGPQLLLWFVGDPSSWILRGLGGRPAPALVLISFYAGLALTGVFWTLSAAVLSFAYRTLVLERTPAGSLMAN